MTPLSLHCPLGFLSSAEEQEYTPHLNGGKNGICGRSHDPFYYNSNPQRLFVKNLPFLSVSQTHWKPRPELGIDLNPDYPSPGNSDSF